MKIIIFGASGKTGQQLVEQALKANHIVTAVVRKPEAFTIEHPNLKVEKGDVLDYASIENLLAGQEAVLSVIGSPNREPTVIYSDGNKNIIRAMEKQHVQRFICLSASMEEDNSFFSFIYKTIIKPLLLKNTYDDLKRMEAAVRSSKLDWILVRPARLTNGTLLGRCRTATEGALKRGWQISRADLANFMLKQLTGNQYIHKAVTIAY